jgi:vitamin B12 transporter
MAPGDLFSGAEKKGTPMNRLVVLFLLALFALSAVPALAQTVPEIPALTPAFAPGGASTFAPDGATADKSAGDPAEAGSIDQVVVTAARIPLPAARVGSSVTVITRHDIEARGADAVEDALRAVPGVDVVRNGAEGNTATMRIRGANSEHTLVLIDGVPANDPSAPSGGFDFSILDAGDIERIEVLRGPQSTLYGSDAIGGVVSIVTHRGRGRPEAEVSLEGGSFGTLREAVSLAGNGSAADWSLALSRKVSQGISAASADEGNTERDGFSRLNLSARLGKGNEDQDGWAVVLRMAREEAELDEFNPATYVFSDDPDSTGRTDEEFLRAVLRRGLGGVFQRAGISLAEYRRRYRNRPDPLNPDDSSSAYDGRRVKADWQGTLALGSHSLTGGVEAGRDEASSDYRSAFFGSESVPSRSADTSAVFLEDSWSVGEAFALALGGRLDRHSRFGDAATCRVAPSWLVAPGLRLRGSCGTGFKAPSLYQLFSPLYGNPDLAAERSRGWDLGAELTLAGGDATVAVTHFANRFTDLIDWVMTDFLTFSGEYRNVARAESRGTEISLHAAMGDGFALKGSATLARSRDLASGLDLPRRPREKYSATLAWDVGEGSSVSLDQTWVGKRRDNSWSAGDDLPAYQLVSLAASTPVAAGWRVGWRAENLLNRKYREIAGYGTTGAAVYMDVKAEL